MGIIDFINQNREYGFTALIAAVALWYIYKQNTNVTLRLQTLEDWSRNTLSELLKESQLVIRDNTRAMRESARAHRDLLSMLSTRACLKDPPDYRPHPSRVSDIEAPVEPPTTKSYSHG